MMPPRTAARARRFAALRRDTCLAALLVLALLAAHLASVPPAARAQSSDQAFLDRVVASLTVNERIGQLVMVNFVGNDVSASSDIATLVRDYNVGSVLVTASNGNIVNRGDTATQIAALTNGLQQRAFDATSRTDAGQRYFLPLFIATDNEGDLFPFTNVTNGYTPIPNNMTIGATWSKRDAQAAGTVVGRELSAAGINLLLGPVVDVLANPRSGGNGDIGIRSFGGDPTWVGELGRAFIRGVHTGSAGRMLTVAKHFPGHGGSDRTTDSEVPTVNKSLDQLRTSDLAPFAEVDRQDAADTAGTTDGMMVSHIRYRNFEPGSTAPFTGPISLDPAGLSQLLQLPEFAAWRPGHFVMSDSLGVPAVKKWYAQQQGATEFPNRTVVHDALMAGSDLLPLVEFEKDPAKPGWRDYQLPVIEDSIQYMRDQYASNPDFRRRADDAVRHIIAAKLQLYPKLQLAQVQVDAKHAAAVAGTGAGDMRTIAEDALTLLQPPTVAELRTRLPRGPQSPEKVVIVECWSDCYPYRVMAQDALQQALLALYGPAGKARLNPQDVSTISFGDLDAWIAKPDDPANAAVASAVGNASWLIFALSEYNPADHPASGAVKRFLDSPPVDLRNKNLIGIAYNVPYHLDSTEISKLSAYFVVYNKTRPAIDAGFRALFGDVTPRGHSPVDVSGVFYSIPAIVQPDPSRPIRVQVFGQPPDAVKDAPTLALVAGPVLDFNGEPVPDGTVVSFTLTRDGGATASATGKTSDGMAGAQLAVSGSGAYRAGATAGSAASQPLAVNVVPGSTPAPAPSPRPQPQAAPSSGGSRVPLLALAIGIPSFIVAIVAAGAGAFVLRRRRALAPALAPLDLADAQSPPPSSVTVVPVAPPALRVDPDTRRVYVHGEEARPPLSNEQFRLLLYLYERAGKVVGREELVQHVWPDAHAEGVSEEALDALVRRVRERIVQAGGQRSYIVTLRGQGFRLEI
ncbi:MAG TPA: glycoside hydrolase family 3 N-terminal domain-containing protein [Dehalococcoidia bacterium]|nr:glycoside hydrolase family 3 N-terminal domain-containing protein [Dehalococcoidia bacterium]